MLDDSNRARVKTIPIGNAMLDHPPRVKAAIKVPIGGAISANRAKTAAKIPIVGQEFDERPVRRDQPQIGK
jgi:hypothetical protein